MVKIDNLNKGGFIMSKNDKDFILSIISIIVCFIISIYFYIVNIFTMSTIMIVLTIINICIFIYEEKNRN
jgi:hypothetical protein